MGESVFRDLETKGFVVFRAFLSHEELEAFRDDYLRQPAGANRNYPIKAASRQANTRLGVRVLQVLAKLNEQTTLSVDFPQGASYFATGRSAGVNFPWHQDHESFFGLQNHYDYLNFYIPIVKPRTDRSNLSIVPFDVLQQETPKTYSRLVRGGATRFVRLGRTRLAICDDSGTIHVVRGNLDRMAHTPMLAAGDLLLMRGDVIHRTQDMDTERVAMSFRASSSKTVVKRSRLADGGLHKANMMANNAVEYERMFKAFDVAKRDELPVGELTALMNTVPVDSPKGRRDFVRYLLIQKLRSHVLCRFCVKVAASYGLNMATYVLKFYDRRVHPNA